ncbi:MAG: FAD-binding oxidoreductase [Bryobacterales bacterium]|nr:FAD-binding oxidoreductase [Bryobacterales bacterium]
MAVPETYLEDASGYKGEAAELFVPASEEELMAVLAKARDARMPVTISGAGTGIVGGRCAEGGWVISMEKFRRLEIGDGFATAGAGVLLREIQSAAAQKGQLYAPDPTENSSAIGGNIAANASGSRSFRYGDTRRHVRALRVLSMDGSVLELRRGQPVPFDLPAVSMPATTKHSAGYWLKPGMDYVDLFIGSEGTLGIVTEAELQLLPAPKHLLTGVIFFSGDEAALSAVEAWRPVERLQMLEYIDAPSLELLRSRFEDIPREARAALLIEQELEREDSEDIDAWADRLVESGALDEASWFAATAADRERFRKFRHALPELVNDTVRRNGYLKQNSDYAVPIARNGEMLRIYRERLEAELPGRYVIFGHIGDAHVHINILPASQEEFDRGKTLMVELAREAVRLGGTVGAEHGLGKRKRHLLELQYTPAELDGMRAVKQRFDPQWLLGRGNLFAAPAVLPS